MVSEFAIEEIEALERDGIRVTPRDVVRLNAYGLKLENRADASEWCACRRAARAGDIVFSEPTLAHEAWLANVGRFFNFADATTFFTVHGFALATPADALPHWQNIEAVNLALAAFAKVAGGITRRQLESAVTFVTLGSNCADFEDRLKESKESEIPSDGTPTAAVAGILRNARFYGVATPMDDIMRMTRAEFFEVVEAARRKIDGVGVEDSRRREKDEAAAKFYSVLDEIRERAKGAENGK